MKKTNFAFMAFASGKESTEGSAVKRYVGVAPVFVLAVNPNKAELEKLYNTQIENEPDYLGEVEVGEDKHKVQNVRLDFIVKTDAEKGVVLPKEDLYRLGKVSITDNKAYMAIAYAANETVGNIPVMYGIKQSAIDDSKAIFAAGGSVPNSTSITSFMCDICGEIAFTGSEKAPAVGKACASTADCAGKYISCANYQVPGGKGQFTTPAVFTFTYHTSADMAEYYSHSNGAYKLKNVKKYADAQAMKAANNDYSSFLEDGNGL